MWFDLTSHFKKLGKVISSSTSVASSLTFLVNGETKLKLLKCMYTLEISLEII